MKKLSKLFASLTIALIVVLGGFTFVGCKGKETKVKSAEQFEEAVKTGGKIKLEQNIDLGSDKSYTISKNLSIDLNGKAITAKIENPNSSKNTNLFNVSGAKLTIKDDDNKGKITLSGKNKSNVNGYIFNVGGQKNNKAEKGSVVINGGNYNVVNDSTILNVIYGEAVINDGIFKVSYDAQNENEAKWGYDYTINRFNKSNGEYKVEGKYPTEFNYDKDVKIVINGGEFYKFDPKNSKASADDPTSGENGYLAKDKTSNKGSGEKADWYIVK